MIAAVVPLKRLTEAKSRLATEMTPARRMEMTISMLRGVIAALQGSAKVERIALATVEHELAAQLGIEVIDDRGSLNGSLRAAACWAEQGNADQLLIVPADLPRLAADDIRVLLAAVASPPAICLAATHDGGTGGLVLAPPGVIPPLFGPLSFDRHRFCARQRGVKVTIIRREGFELDVDTVADLPVLSGCVAEHTSGQ